MRYVRIRKDAGNIYAGNYLRSINLPPDITVVMIVAQKAHWLEDNAGQIVKLKLITALCGECVIEIDGKEEVIPYNCLEEI